MFQQSRDDAVVIEHGIDVGGLPLRLRRAVARTITALPLLVRSGYLSSCKPGAETAAPGHKQPRTETTNSCPSPGFRQNGQAVRTPRTEGRSSGPGGAPTCVGRQCRMLNAVPKTHASGERGLRERCCTTSVRRRALRLAYWRCGGGIDVRSRSMSDGMVLLATMRRISALVMGRPRCASIARSSR